MWHQLPSDNIGIRGGADEKIAGGLVDAKPFARSSLLFGNSGIERSGHLARHQDPDGVFKVCRW